MNVRLKVISGIGLGIVSCATVIFIMRLLGKIGVTPTESGFAILLTATLFSADQLISAHSANGGEIIMKLQAILSYLEERDEERDRLL
jgi:hypothetical protein